MKQNTAMEHLNKAFELLEKYPQGLDCVGDIPEELILKAENVLNLKFPPTYRQFLKKYGYCGFFGAEIYGIAKDAISHGGQFEPSHGPDGIGETLGEREQFQLPEKYIIVGAPGYGPLDAIDTSKPDEHGECPVVMIDGPYKNPDTGEKKEWYEMEQMAPDFGTYLYNQSKAALQNAIDSGEVEA
tara:strand:+ start:164 stop:718 length:555 start_codon:yes stop_codon:yes gene_type:complete